MKLTSSLIFISFISSICGFKVLGVFPYFSKSHFAIGSAIVESLHEAGHDITVISPFPKKNKVPRYHDISVVDFYEKNDEVMKMNVFDVKNMPLLLVLPFIYKYGSEIVDGVMEDKKIQDFLSKDEKFDVCVIEIFSTDAFVGFADHFDCNLITFCTMESVEWVNDKTGNQMPTSYVPHSSLHYTEKMNFMGRLENTFMTLLDNVEYQIHKWNQRRLYNKHFPNAKRSFDEVYMNSSIVFLNQHVSSASARPLLPNMIEINGIHIQPVKPLPKDFQDFLDSAKNGAILFSMGSPDVSVHLPTKQREVLTKVLGKLKQKIIWKYENDTLPDKPDNIMISKWIPQRDIMAHPNVKLFITHGGLLGTTEAIAEGKPILGFPILGDQKMNVAKAVERGYGLKIEIDDINEEILTETLNELLENSKYSQVAKKLSERFNDRPMTPKETVVFWTEHVVRHKGADYLKAEGRNMNFFIFHSIDSYVTIGIIFIIFVSIDILILICVWRYFHKKKPIVDQKKKSN